MKYVKEFTAWILTLIVLTWMVPALPLMWLANKLYNAGNPFDDSPNLK